MDTVENSSQTISHLHPQRTDGPPPNCATCTAASSSAILYNGIRAADTSVAESILNIRSLIHSPSRIAIARSLRGIEAQGLIDHIDQASEKVFCPTPATPFGAYEMTWHSGHHITRTGRETSKTMFAPSLQGLQSLRNVAHIVYPTTRVNPRRQNPLFRRVCGCQRRRVPGTSCGHQAPPIRD